MALNKIFIHRKDLSYSEVKESDSDITFIRKDALLEWAKAVKADPMIPMNIDKVIEKIESL